MHTEIAQLKPVGAVRIGSHPFVEFQTGYGIQRRRRVERAGCGNIERPRAGAIWRAPDGAIRDLQTERNGINQPAAISQAVEQKQGAAAGVEGEAGVVRGHGRLIAVSYTHLTLPTIYS